MALVVGSEAATHGEGRQVQDATERESAKGRGIFEPGVNSFSARPAPREANSAHGSPIAMSPSPHSIFTRLFSWGWVSVALFPFDGDICHICVLRQRACQRRAKAACTPNARILLLVASFNEHPSCLERTGLDGYSWMRCFWQIETHGKAPKPGTTASADTSHPQTFSFCVATDVLGSELSTTSCHIGDPITTWRMRISSNCGHVEC
jgi:hypothetical protein